MCLKELTGPDHTPLPSFSSSCVRPRCLSVQGLPVLVGLIEDSVTENGKLTGIGVDCIWRVLEVHGSSPLNHLCRLLANAGLAHRLMRAMLTLNQEYQLALTHAEVHTFKTVCCAQQLTRAFIESALMVDIQFECGWMSSRQQLAAQQSYDYHMDCLALCPIPVKCAV